MSQKDTQQQIIQAAEILKQSKTTVALTGAGISTPSGIPDFRSPNSGLWEHVNPMEVASIAAFRLDPAKFYDWVRPLSTKLLQAKPNPAHYALAQLEAANRLQNIITQNIDGLHQAANSKHVLEVHGHTRTATCARCYASVDASAIMQALMDGKEIPLCEDCGGPLKPDVILFGEQLPVHPLFESRIAVTNADTILVVGSSLEVTPISDLPHDALQNGSKLIIINIQETYLDNKADVVIHADVTEILPQIVSLVLDS